MSKQGFDIVSGADKLEFWKCWDILVSQSQFQQPMYCFHGIEYYREYFREHEFLSDQSIIILKNDRPVAGMIISISKFLGIATLSGFGRGLNYIETENIDRSTIIQVRKFCRTFLQQLISEYSIQKILYREYSSIDGIVCPIGRLLLDQGARSRLWFLQVIDLLDTAENIKANMAKSCRHSINVASKLYNTRILSHSNPEAIERLKELHYKASKRATKSNLAWQFLGDMVGAKNAFIAEVLDGDKCISSALFAYNDATCLYSVSASDREYFGHPVNHALIWQAILHAKNLKCKTFEFGGLYYNVDEEKNMVSKEKNINRFKKNFGGRTVYQLQLELNINSVTK